MFELAAKTAQQSNNGLWVVIGLLCVLLGVVVTVSAFTNPKYRNDIRVRSGIGILIAILGLLFAFWR